MKYAHALFCEDIRHEASGQASYIGVYRGRVYIDGELPRTVRLNAVVWVVSTDNVPFEEVTLAIEKPNGKTTFLPYPDLPRPALESTVDEPYRLVAQGEVKFAGLEITDAESLGLLRAWARIDGVWCKAGELELVRGANEDDGA